MNFAQSPTEGRAAASTSNDGIVDPLLTLPEIANELRCSKAHVSHLLNGKVPGVPRLPSIALGRRRLIRRSTFEQWKKMCEAATLPPLNDAVSA
jgi:excisionase family DNA binding protein